MKSNLFLILFLASCSFANAQSNSWDKWKWLIGEWRGEGSGEPGKGGGTFSLLPDLNDKILIRRNHSEYPATADKPKIVHDDLMIVYQDFQGNPSKAIYFDNENHTINYSIGYSDKKIILMSDKAPHYPVFRLTYTDAEAGVIMVKFEMAQDQENFKTYTQGKCVRVK